MLMTSLKDTTQENSLQGWTQLQVPEAILWLQVWRLKINLNKWVQMINWHQSVTKNPSDSCMTVLQPMVGQKSRRMSPQFLVGMAISASLLTCLMDAGGTLSTVIWTNSCDSGSSMMIDGIVAGVAQGGLTPFLSVALAILAMLLWKEIFHIKTFANKKLQGDPKQLSQLIFLWQA